MGRSFRPARYASKCWTRKWNLRLTQSIVLLIWRASAPNHSHNISLLHLPQPLFEIILVTWGVSTGVSTWSSVCCLILSQMKGQHRKLFWRNKRKSLDPSLFLNYNIFALQSFMNFCRCSQQCITNFYGPADEIVAWSREGMHHHVQNLIIEHDLVSWSDCSRQNFKFLMIHLAYRTFQLLIQSCFVIYCHSRPTQTPKTTKIRIYIIT